MNFKKSWKRANDGFTLVELIVVIAILAILAGIAVPAYSGYIKKANEAADYQVLAAVNTAFAAAVLENGDDFNNITYAKLKTTANGDGVTINGLASVTGGKAVLDKYRSSFATYIEPDVTTKVIGEFDYVRGVGFVDKDSDIAKKTVAYGGTNYQVNVGSIEAFKGSVYSENVDGLQDQLNSLSTSFGQIVGDADLTELFGEEFNEYVKDLPADQRGNAAVLYVAEKAGSYDAQQIGQLFTTAASNLPTDKVPTMRDLLDAFPAESGDDALVNVAMMYGAVTAYANSDNCPDAFKTQVEGVSNGQDLINVFTTLATPGEVQNSWNSYIGTNNGGVLEPSDTFTQDVNGFLGAMDAIDSVSGGLNTGNTSLWNDEAMDNLLAELLK